MAPVDLHDAKDTRMTNRAKSEGREKDNRRQPEGEVGVAHSQFEKFISECFDALLDNVSGGASEGDLDDDVRVNAFLGKRWDDEPGCMAVDEATTAQASYAVVGSSATSESSLEEALAQKLQRRKSQATMVHDRSPSSEVCVSTVSSTPSLADNAQESTTRAHSSPKESTVLERVHELLGLQPRNTQVTATSTPNSGSPMLLENIDVNSTTSATSSGQLGSAMAATSEGIESGIIASNAGVNERFDSILAPIIAEHNRDADSMDTASAATNVEELFGQDDSDQPRARVNSGEGTTVAMQQSEQTTVGPSSLSTLASNRPACAPTPASSTSSSRQSTAAPAVSAERTVIPNKFAHPNETHRVGIPQLAGQKRPKPPGSARRAPKRRETAMSPPSPADTLLPPHLWRPITVETTWRPPPDGTNDWAEMVERLHQYKILTGGMGGLPWP